MRVLLHICCAVCASACVERLAQEGHQVTGFFYNPNIQPEEEYLKRLEVAKELAEGQDFPLIVDDYNANWWLKQIKGLEEEAEGGRRCAKCFSIRLKKTAEFSKDKGFDAFTTTLTISPHKNTQVINGIGETVGNGLFLARDFKKQDGFRRAQQLSKQYNFYHQSYCGCIYSLDIPKDK